MSQPARNANKEYTAPDLKRGPGPRAGLVALAILLCGAAALLLAAATFTDLLPERLRAPGALGAAVALLGVILLAYAARSEARLRHLAEQLADERVLSTAYSNRVRDLSALVSTTRTINGVLELDVVLSTLLDESLTAFRSSEGSLMLLDDSGFLETACARGNQRALNARIKIGDSVAGHVALTREPLLLHGTASTARFHRLVSRARSPESAMSVPLIHRDELLGVLNVNASPGRVYTDHDLQLLTVFAGHAAIAVANATAVAGYRHRIAELTEANRVTAELIASMRHDLRAPLQGLGTDLAALDRTVDDPGEIHAAMRRSLRRLAAAVDNLLEEAGAGGESLLETPESADLAAMARYVAEAFRGEGRDIEVGAPATCGVGGDPSLLEQVLWNLLDNAFTHGEPPVRIDVWAARGQGILAVSDHGRGISPGERERLFEQFSSGRTRGSIMGLGLSMVHGIVSACGGRVWAEDDEEGGARFCVAVPLAPAVKTEGVPA